MRNTSISFKLNLCFFIIILLSNTIALRGQNIAVYKKFKNQAFRLVDNTNVAKFIIDNQDYEGVHIAAENLRNDIERVSAVKPEYDQVIKNGGNVIIGTLGKSKYLEELIIADKINFDSIENKWEAYTIQQIDGNLVIAGSDKRGTIYGIYTLSELIGVSPWYWWADVPVEQSNKLYITANNVINPGPKVQYRGIFINDEAPALSGWVGEKFGSFNHQFYEHVFELILRLKGNYLWPAMWGRAFYDDDPLNPKLADTYGVVIGTSHHEPLMRAHSEWGKYGNGPWNYTTNAKTLRKFWGEGIKRMGTNESIVTIGMRGDGDEPMTEGTAIELLETVVKDQRKIIQDITRKPAEETPQIWALYKEVQDYYDQGMRVPDDVTLLLADDNWGNIRKLPDPKDFTRTGGYGIYYHFDYVGGPRNYKWLNTTQIARVYEQMSLAYAYNVKKIWIVNVGDIKPMEFPISFFLDYAWDPENFNLSNLESYTINWVKKQFGNAHAVEIAALMQSYSTMVSRRKPELLGPETWSLNHFNEANRVLKEYKNLELQATAIEKKLSKSYKSAFYQLVLYPIKALANLNRLYIATAKNRQFANQGRNTTNDYANKVSELFEMDQTLTDTYHSLNNSKWNHFMDQTHIGYTSWQEPKKNIQPLTEKIEIPQKGNLGIAIEGTDDYFPKVSTLKLLPFDDNHQTQKVELFNTGLDQREFRIENLPDWLLVDTSRGSFNQEHTIEIKLNPIKLPLESTSAMFKIGSNGKAAKIEVNYILKDDQLFSNREYNGIIAIPSDNFQENVGWEEIAHLGRQNSALRPEHKFSEHINYDNTKLVYQMYTGQELQGTITFYVSPTLDFKNQGGLVFKYQIDNGPIKHVNIHKDTKDDWGTSVSNNATRVQASIHLSQGAHSLKIIGEDPGIVLQQILIQSNENLQESYLVPNAANLIEE